MLTVTLSVRVDANASALSASEKVDAAVTHAETIHHVRREPSCAPSRRLVATSTTSIPSHWLNASLANIVGHDPLGQRLLVGSRHSKNRRSSRTMRRSSGLGR